MRRSFSCAVWSATVPPLGSLDGRFCRLASANSRTGQRANGVFQLRADSCSNVDRPWMRRAAGGVCDDALAAPVRVPRLHRRAFVRLAEVGEHGVAGVDVSEVAADDLLLVTLRPAAEVAPHRIDRLPAQLARELRRPAAVLVGERRSGEVDARHGAYSTAMGERSTEFVALCQAGTEAYAGLDTFEMPGVAQVELTSDGLVAMCPVASQPDMYGATI